MLSPEHFVDSCGVKYESGHGPGDSKGHISIRVLECLTGKPWDNIALAYVSALRPSSIRVSGDTITCDSRLHRVTVYLDEDGLIQKVSQEVDVDLPEGVSSGIGLEQALRYGVDSPQSQFFNSRGKRSLGVDMKGWYKILEDGTRVDYPQPTKP